MILRYISSGSQYYVNIHTFYEPNDSFTLESSKQGLDQTMNSTMQDQDDGGKRGVENKRGEPDLVSTATLIDILQVEQLSSSLATAS